MTETIIVALISGAVALTSGLVSGIISSKLTNYRIEQLERKVDKHNGLVERMVTVEERSKSNTHRIEGLEGTKR